MATKLEALDQIADMICGCFGHVDLLFAIHGPDQQVARMLRRSAREWRLSKDEVESSIEPRIRDWLQTGFWGHGASAPGPWGDNDLRRRSMIVAMVDEAARYLADK